METKQIVFNDILFTLYVANDIGWPDLNRTNFQKILFFSAVLSPLAEIDWGYDFTNANYGPFNRTIHRATDFLVLQRYAEITNLKLQRDSKLRARYRISDRGIMRVKRITQLKREGARLEWINMIMQILDIYGSQLITKLAYREPTFKQMRSQNKGGTIALLEEDNKSIDLVDKLSKELEGKFSVELDTLMSKLIVYFDFLSDNIGKSPE